MKRKKLSNFYLSSKFNFYIYYVLKSIYRFLFFNIVPDKVFLKRKFKKRMGYKLDLNNPIDFNEKLQWLKLYDREKEYTDCADKYKSREYIKKVLGADADKYLIPLLFETKNVNDLCPENLPDYPVIIKTNHDQGGYKIIWDKSNVNWKKIQKYFSNRLKWNFYWSNREWPYKNIERRIIVEKLLTENGKLPIEIKIYFFHGDDKFYQVVNQNEHTQRSCVFLDNNFNMISSYIPENCYPILEPFPQEIYSYIDEMVGIGKKLSASKKFLRVDYYIYGNKIYIGELTFSPSAGYIKYFSNDFLKEVGSWLKVN